MDTVLNIPAAVIQQHFRCGICKGFLVDATALPECDHQFCKSCIVPYCEKPVKDPVLCPVAGCGALIHKAKPLSQIKNDTTMQTLAYKLFPKLYVDEMELRRKFYEENPNQRELVTGSEELGIRQNFSWLPPVIPNLVSLRLLFDDLVAPLADFSWESRIARLVVPNTVLWLGADAHIGIVRNFLQCKYRLPVRDMVVIMHSTTILKDELPLSHIIRFYGKGQGTADLTLSYFFLDVKGFSDELDREATIIRLIRKKPVVSLLPSKALADHEAAVPPECENTAERHDSPVLSPLSHCTDDSESAKAPFSRPSAPVAPAIPCSSTTIPPAAQQAPVKGHIGLFAAQLAQRIKEAATLRRLKGSQNANQNNADNNQEQAAAMERLGLFGRPVPMSTEEMKALKDVEESGLLERMKRRSITAGIQAVSQNVQQNGRFIGPPLRINYVLNDSKAAPPTESPNLKRNIGSISGPSEQPPVFVASGTANGQPLNVQRVAPTIMGHPTITIQTTSPIHQMSGWRSQTPTYILSRPQPAAPRFRKRGPTSPPSQVRIAAPRLPNGAPVTLYRLQPKPIAPKPFMPGEFPTISNNDFIRIPKRRKQSAAPVAAVGPMQKKVSKEPSPVSLEKPVEEKNQQDTKEEQASDQDSGKFSLGCDVKDPMVDLPLPPVAGTNGVEA